ncbi:MAG: hypothetical protein JO035_10955 [Betaproteobacteria bacterium]|nr:hypothetical protein [Betaproteobacteria bacterium]
MRAASALLLLLLPAIAAAGELGLNLYSASYHFERSRARDLGLDNEFNPGAGVRYRDRLAERWDWFVDAGAYRDSGRHTAIVAGPGAFWKAGEGLRLGGALAFFHSASYNQGRAFIAPVPVAAYEWRSVSLNVTYFPRISNFNDINTLGFWVTIWPAALQ